MRGNRSKLKTAALARNGLLFLLAVGAGAAAASLFLGEPAHEPDRAFGTRESGSTESGPVRSPSREQLREIALLPILGSSAEGTAPLDVPDVLSAFQDASLRDPSAAGKLRTELILSLREAYAQAANCYSRSEPSTLEFSFEVESRGMTANVVGARFVGVNRGAPVEPAVVECATRPLDRTFTLFADENQLFPKELDAEVPVEITLGRRSTSP